jgi:hypothetical protein
MGGSSVEDRLQTVGRIGYFPAEGTLQPQPASEIK